MTTVLPPPQTRLQRWTSFRFRAWVHELISPGGTAHELALGASIGVFVGLTPLFGLHLVLILIVALLLQRLVRFNKALAVAFSYANNPVTFAPILWASYRVGTFLMPTIAGDQIQATLLPQGIDWHGGLRALPQILYGMGLPMLVGCLVLGAVMAVVAYPVTYTLVMWYRRGGAAVSPDMHMEPLTADVISTTPAP